ncbi:hypothetical protein HNS03_04090 [Amorphus sp. 3PC139-8]
MEALFAALEATGAATWLRMSRWGYAAVNAAHILGLAALVGAVIPLDLRLLGAWPQVLRRDVARVLVPVAACGLAVAVTTGAFLFSVRPQDYAAIAIFQFKMVFVVLGTFAAILAHVRHGTLLDRGEGRYLQAHAAFSLFCWLSTLICGRMIAFAAG